MIQNGEVYDFESLSFLLAASFIDSPTINSKGQIKLVKAN